MSNFYDALLKKHKELEVILKKTEASADASPDLLRISHDKGQTRCYLRKPGSSRSEEHYCRKDNIEAARLSAQTDYEKKLHQAALHQWGQFRKFIAHYSDSELADVFEKLIPQRQELIQPLITSNETYAKTWQSGQYAQKPFDEDAPFFLTERGERVRSKSEKIIADRYYKLGIPYHYEKPVDLKDGNRNLTFHPDFTVLNVRTRQFFYHEHFGKMDDAGYCESALWKLDVYVRNGIIPGRHLIITHETSTRPLDTRILDTVIRAWFL